MPNLPNDQNKVKKGESKALRALRFLLLIPRFPFLGIIWVYQRTISPDHGPLHTLFPQGYCQFSPSCSAYGFAAYAKHGALKGTILTVYRILRCNPWNSGGVDPVPEKFSDIRIIHKHGTNA